MVYLPEKPETPVPPVDSSAHEVGIQDIDTMSNMGENPDPPVEPEQEHDVEETPVEETTPQKDPDTSKTEPEPPKRKYTKREWPKEREYPRREREPAKVYEPVTGTWKEGPSGIVKEVAYFPNERCYGIVHSVLRYERKISKHLDTYTNLPEPPSGPMPEGYEFPPTLHKALNDPYAKKWKEAIVKEHNQIRERGVYEVVRAPPGAKIMDSKWVFVVKFNVDKTIDKFKARLCAKGFSSIPGVHHNETFAPTASLAAARLMFALGATCNAEIEQMDVSGAFLYGDLEEEIYMRPPPGLEEPDGKVWRLKKSLYGLKQAPRTWCKALQKVLIEEGFVASKIEPTLYILHKDGESMYVLVFVDDLLMVTTSKALSKYIKPRLMSRFDMTDLGDATKYLGWHVQRDRQKGTLWLSLEKKIREGLVTFGLQDSSATATPLPTDFKAWYAHEMDLKDPTRQPPPGSPDKYSPRLTESAHSVFRQKVGFLQYVAQALRPDIAYAANQLAAVQHVPRERHMKAADHCLRYCKGTAHLGLCYRADTGQTLKGYTDSDFAGCQGGRKSTTGWLFTLAGSPVSWKSKKQDCVTTSSCEAEYVALTSGVKECMWLRDLLSEFGVPIDGPTPVYCDNEAAVRISRDPVCHSRTKHVSTSFWFVREQQQTGIVKVTPIPTKAQLADHLTKSLNRPQFESVVQMSGQAIVPHK
jgi:hypothetical protein